MNKLYAKLLKVQAEMKAIEKDSVNPHFKNRYFDINSLLAELKPVLTKHGLIVLQPIMDVDGYNRLQTLVIDAESGESLTSGVRLPDGKAQELGSALTYFRRYSLTSLFALEAEDDDGEIATKTVDLGPVETKPCPSCGKTFAGKYPMCYSCKLKKGASNVASG